MKWSILGLGVVGVVAALSVAVLVAFQRAGNGRKAGPAISSEVEILVASRDLPDTCIIESSALEPRLVTREKAEADALSDPAQVVGRVLALPMVKGQPFTRSCFAGKGSGLNLAATLKDGWRAAAVSLTDHGALTGLIYPGSVVDVLASFRATRNDGRREVMSLTLLSGVQVLAVEDQSVVSQDKPEAQADRSFSRGRLVTLKVSAKQAELLQLAQEYGTISLAMRNPTDTVQAADSMTLLSSISDFLKGQTPPSQSIMTADLNSVSPATQPTTQAFAQLPTTQPSDLQQVANTQSTGAIQEPAKPLWLVTFIRGSSSHVESYDMPEAAPTEAR